jgi:predicted DCC family thiol-disulfide oxidoreductase YuxK
VEPRGVLFFDGPCPLCQRAVFLLLRWDRRGRLRFAPLEGATATRLGLAPGGAESGAPETLLFLPWPPALPPLERSDAVLAALAALCPVPRAFAALLRRVPRAGRDALYRAVASRRGRWFGRDAACPSPPPAFRDRFLP